VADTIRTEILGADELSAGMRTLAGKIEDAAPKAFQAVANDVAGTVAGRVPKLTGALAASVTPGVQGEAAVVQMGDGVPYARFVEYGGRGHPHSAQGNYLYPAAQDAEPLLIAAGIKAANDEIGGMRWPSPT
jgi:phage gpG-like protein